MAQSGSLIVRVYASRAQLPIQGATVLVSQRDGQGQNQLYSALVTDESGIAGPLSLPAPDADLSHNPRTPPPPSPPINSRLARSANELCFAWADGAEGD